MTIVHVVRRIVKQLSEGREHADAPGRHDLCPPSCTRSPIRCGAASSRGSRARARCRAAASASASPSRPRPITSASCERPACHRAGRAGQPQAQHAAARRAGAGASRACWRPCSAQLVRGGGPARCMNADMRWGTPTRRVAVPVLAAVALALVALSLPPPPRFARSFSQSRPVVWISVAAGQPSTTCGSRRPPAARSVTTAAARFRAALSDERLPRGTGCAGHAAGRRQDAPGDADVWSAAQFSPPRWSADGGATWQPGALRGADAHYDFGVARRLRRRVPGHGRPDRSAHRLVLPGQPLRRRTTRAAPGRWRRRASRRPWHCVALAIAPGEVAHAAPAGAVERRTPSAFPASCCAASTAARPGIP